MKKEIGSIFPLCNETLCEAESKQSLFSDDKLYYSLCREALSDIAVSLQSSSKTVLIPAYTCQTVITPFKEAGWKCVYYPILKNLRIDVESLEDIVAKYSPSVMVVHPYFGMELNVIEVKELQRISKKNVKVVLDLTQCLFSTKRYSFVSFTVGSFRKWFPIPDGGFIEKNENTLSIIQPDTENTDFTDAEMAAMYLRGQYFMNGDQRTKAISIRLSKTADILAESDIAPHKMSKVAYNLMQKENLEYNQKRRFANYAFLFHNLCESNKTTKVCKNLDDVTTAPLYFAIYVQDRSSLQYLLAQESIYAPVIWPVEDEKVLIRDDVKYIYNHLLAIPCDQRYDEKDMQRVLDIINNY